MRASHTLDPQDTPRPSSSPASTSRLLLEISGLAVRRGKRSVLAGLDLQLHRGECFGLLGPNGAGKTTLFHALLGLVRPDAGSLRFDGHAVQPGDRQLRARAGVVFQEPALDPALSARENLLLAARLYGVPRSEARSRVAELLEAARLSDRAQEPVSRLSGGMRRRIELARARIHRPELLILDEPTNGLDEAAFRRFWSELRALRDDGGFTVLLTTHRPEEAEQCDRLAVLDGGRVVACDTPDALREQVRGDWIEVDTQRPEQIADIFRRKLGVPAQLVEGRVCIRHEAGHRLIPRLVECVPEGTLQAIRVRPAGLGEAFLQLTGHGLEQPGPLVES